MNKAAQANGKLGGLRGGPARAKALSATERSAVARRAARARWKPEMLTLTQPKTLGELEGFVAFYGNGVAKHGACDPAAVLVRAVTACRKNACLARMIPVFIWRARQELRANSKKLVEVSGTEACVLGYFLELTRRLAASHGDMPGVTRVLADLHKMSADVVGPVVLFDSMRAPMFAEYMAQRTSALATSWKLLLGESDESFANYFYRKVS